MWKGWVSGHWEKSKPQTIYLMELRVKQIKSNLRKKPTFSILRPLLHLGLDMG